MADGIDPNIALSYRPPNLAAMPNLQVQTPLESLARVVSLRSLMQEGELKGLQLQQLKQQLQGARNLANLYNSMYPDTGAGDGTTTSAAGFPTAPTGGITITQPYAIPPPAPLAGGAPVTPLGVDVTAGLDKYLSPPTTAPTPDTGTAVTPTATPAIPGTPPPGLFAPAPEPRTPTLGEFVRADPLGGVAAYESMMKARKEMYDEADKRLTLRKSQSKAVADLLNGVNDQESLVRNLPEMVRTGGLSGAQADYIRQRGYDNPFVQKWIQEKQIQSIGYDQAVDLAIKKVKSGQDTLMFGTQYPKALADQEAAEAQNSANSVDQVLSDKDWPGWFKNQGPTSQAKYAPIITNPSLTFSQKVQMIKLGAGGAQKAAEAAATDAAKHAEQIRQDEPLIQGILAGQYSLQDQSQAVQDRIGPELVRRQAARTAAPWVLPGTPGAPAGAPATGTPEAAAPAPGAPQVPAVTPGPAAGTPAAGGGAPASAPFQFGKRPSDAEIQRLSDLQRAWTIANELQKKIREPQSIDLMGPVAGLRSLSPYASATNSLKDYLGSAQQALKKFQTQGSLRGFTEKQLDEMSPTIYTHPDEANQQVVNMKNTITAEYEQLVKDLQGAGKVVPEALIPKTGPAPQLAPPKEPQATPAQVPADVSRQLNRGAGKYTLPDGRVFYKKKDGSIVPGQ